MKLMTVAQLRELLALAREIEAAEGLTPTHALKQAITLFPELRDFRPDTTVRTPRRKLQGVWGACLPVEV